MVWFPLCAIGHCLANSMLADDRCPFYDSGTLSDCAQTNAVMSKEEYHRELKQLNIKNLYSAIEELMKTSQECWPADGHQDKDIPSYAGLFGRLAWHCSGSFRLINHTGKAAGGCEGGRQRFWPENQWRDNSNLDKARGLLGKIKAQFGNQVSWGDLMTFAGTVAIKASGGPAKKFCFGRVDDADGSRSLELGVQGVNGCDKANMKSDAPCETSFHWPEQDESDNARCNLTQDTGRLQASHSVGLIYVYPEGPQLKKTDSDYNRKWVHNRSPRLSALEVRDTFANRMGWTDRETVALIGGGHTLGRTHGNCNLAGTKWAKTPYNNEGPNFEAVPGTGRGPTDGTCGVGPQAGMGPNTVSSGFDGAWTRTPSQWSYDYFEALIAETWEPVKSPYGNDQWWTKARNSTFSSTRRLTADMSLVADETYKKIASEYLTNHELFDSEFAAAWYKLVHRSADHPHEDDLEKDAGVCTSFEFLKEAKEVIV
jgi:catalase (peroxidase I)